MALLVNKKEIKTVIFNGVSLKELIVNGITVFKRFLGLWVRREMFEESHLNLKETWQLDDHIYYSYSGRHYELDRETNTWVKKNMVWFH